jgi:hypothetical protein
VLFFPPGLRTDGRVGLPDWGFDFCPLLPAAWPLVEREVVPDLSGASLAGGFLVERGDVAALAKGGFEGLLGFFSAGWFAFLAGFSGTLVFCVARAVF